MTVQLTLKIYAQYTKWFHRNCFLKTPKFTKNVLLSDDDVNSCRHTNFKWRYDRCSGNNRKKNISGLQQDLNIWTHGLCLSIAVLTQRPWVWILLKSLNFLFLFFFLGGGGGVNLQLLKIAIITTATTTSSF